MKFPLHRILLFNLDIFSVIIALYLSNMILFQDPRFQVSSHQFLQLRPSLFFLSVFLGFLINRMYSYQVILDPYKHFVNLIRSLIYGMFFLIIFSFLFKISDILFQRKYLVVFLLLLFSFDFIFRVFLVPSIYYWLIRIKFIRKNLLIIGAGEFSTNISRFLLDNKKSYFNIVGFLDDDPLKQNSQVNGKPVLGPISAMKDPIGKLKVSDILISINNISDNRLSEIIQLCKETKKEIYIISKYYKSISQKLEVEEIADISAFRISYKQKSFYDYYMTFINIAFSIFLIIPLIPFFAVIIVLIKTSSKGSLFYKSRMIGKNGNEFLMYKFRSMYSNASTKAHEEYTKKVIAANGQTFKLKNDVRVTKIGRFLRKFSIDEFPQLINVIKGDMNLVGPRPCLKYEYDVMDEWHKRRFEVKPGMTGLWQIRGRNEVRFNEQIALDIFYIEHRSLRLDLEIILKTIPVVLFGRGGL
jgi:exopolysaccharide biosynthesis polyprenyl glycosylphosphotransferase